MKQHRNWASKPYNKCLSCHHRGIKCDGPRTSAMTLERWCEFMRDMKDIAGMSNQDVADESGVSLKTVERLMAGRVDQDIRRDTARAIENVIIGSSNQYPCYMESDYGDTQKLSQAMLELERAVNDNKDYRKILDDIHNSYNAEMERIREDARSKLDYLLTQISRQREEIDYLRRENERKSKIVDKYIEGIEA